MSILDIPPDLIRVKSDSSNKCFFCKKQSYKVILGENNKELFLCKDHFRELAKTLYNFKY